MLQTFLLSFYLVHSVADLLIFSFFLTGPCPCHQQPRRRSCHQEEAPDRFKGGMRGGRRCFDLATRQAGERSPIRLARPRLARYRWPKPAWHAGRSTANGSWGHNNGWVRTILGSVAGLLRQCRVKRNGLGACVQPGCAPLFVKEALVFVTCVWVLLVVRDCPLVHTPKLARPPRHKISKAQGGACPKRQDEVVRIQ